MCGYWRLVGRPLVALLLALVVAVGGSSAAAQEPDPQPSDLAEVASELVLFRDGRLDADAVLSLSSAVAAAREPTSAVLVSQAQLMLELAADYDDLTDQASTSDLATIAAEAAELQEHIKAAATTILEPNLATNLAELDRGVRQLARLDQAGSVSGLVSGPDTKPSGPATWLILAATAVLVLGLIRSLTVRRTQAHN